MSWIAEKLKKDTEDMTIRAMPGDLDTLKDMDYMLKHPGEASSLSEVRDKRLAEDLDIERKAAEEKKARDEARAAARAAELEAYTIDHLNKHIVVTIAGRRLTKISGFKDLKCDKCGAALYKVRGMVIAAGDMHRRSVNGGNYPNPLQQEAAKCPECKTVQPVMVQVVW